jgi:outer membrane protein
MRNNLISKTSVINKQAQEQEANQIENMEKELNRKREDFRDELAERESDLKEKILNDVVGIVNEIGDSEGYTLIVEKNEAGVLYGSQSADITDKVIRAYDKKHEEGKGVSKR